MKKATYLLLFVLILALLAPVACLPAPTQVTDNTYNDYNPQMAVDPSGNAYLAWCGDVGWGDEEIFWAKVDTTGTVTVTQVTDDAYYASSPQIVIDTSGNSYIVWHGWDGTDYEIYWAKVDSSGTVTNTSQVTVNTIYEYNPQIAVDSSGNSYITWNIWVGGHYDIYWAKLNSTGAVTNSIQITSNTFNGYYPMIAVDSSGNSYITWYEYQLVQEEIFWAKVDTTGTVTVTQVTNNAYREFEPHIVIDSSSNSYISWYGNEGGNDSEIFWAKVDSSGTVTNTTQVTSDTYEDIRSQIVIDTSANTFLTWSKEAGGDSEIYWAKLNSTGTVTNTTHIADDTYLGYFPMIAVDSSSNSYLTWYGLDGLNGEILWAKLDPSGAIVISSEVTDNDYTDYTPKIAVDSSGNPYLTWHGDEGNDDREVFFLDIANSIWSIGLSYGTSSITAGESVTYSVEGFGGLGNSLGDVTGSTTFSIGAGAGGSWAGGAYTSEYTGTWTVTATNGFSTDTAPLTVNAGPLSSIVVSPGVSSITAGDSVTYSVEGFDSMGNSLGDVTGSTTFSIDTGAGGSWAGGEYTSASVGTWTVTATNGIMTDTASLTVDYAHSLSNPFIFRVIANMQLAKANHMWECISERLPNELPEAFQEMVDEVQEHMENASSLSNPIYSNGELITAMGIMKGINEALELNCECD